LDAAAGKSYDQHVVEELLMCQRREDDDLDEIAWDPEHTSLEWSQHICRFFEEDL